MIATRFIAPNTRTTSQTYSLFNHYLLIVVLLLPIVRYRLPGNTIFLDFWNILTIPFLLFTIQRNHLQIRGFYVLPMGFIVFGSLVATLSSENMLESLLVLTKGIYLYGWFLILTSILFYTQANQQTFFKWWLWIATAHAILLIAQLLSPELLQQTTQFVGKYAENGSQRPLGLLRNPNMAATYQLISFIPLIFIQLSLPKKIIIGTLLFVSILSTASLTAIMAIFILVALLLFQDMIILQRTRTLRIIPFVSIILIVLAVVLFSTDGWSRLQTLTIERISESWSLRTRIFERSLTELDTIWGVGPGQFEPKITEKNIAPHNDFVTFTIERGWIGGFGLVFFVIMIMTRLWTTLQHYPHARQSVTVLLFFWVAFAILSQFHQIFHFRFLWVFLAFQEATIWQIRTSQTT